VAALRPVSYEKRLTMKDTEYNIKEEGFIAQEIRKVLPDLVSESKDADKTLTVNYTAIIPLLTKAIQEQQTQIQEQQTQIQEQQAQLQAQQAQLQAQQAQIDMLIKAMKK
jgi:DNA-binding transcriptional MerR regulator